MPRRARKFLTYQEWKTLSSQIAEAVEAKLDEWGAHGWSIVGAPDQLRISVRVAERLVEPLVPIAPIRVHLNDRWIALKPAVHASHRTLMAKSVGSSRKMLHGIRTQPVELAPSHPIEIAKSATGSRRERAGITCFVTIDGELHLVTCGHAFQGGRTQVFEVGRTRQVGSLRDDFLRNDHTIDVAVVQLTAYGRQRVSQDRFDAPWMTKAWPPRQDHEGAFAELFPSNAFDPQVREARIVSVSASEPQLLPGSAGTGLIQTEICSMDGDSGAPLYYKKRLYGLCSGTVGVFSFFTPLLPVFGQLRARYGRDVYLWEPS